MINDNSLTLGLFLNTYFSQYYPNEKLTKTEIKVLQLIIKGYTNSEISQALYIAPSTVKTHLNNLYLKFSLTDDRYYKASSCQRLRLALSYLSYIELEKLKKMGAVL